MSHLGREQNERKVFYRIQKVSLAIIVNIAKSATDKCVNELVNVNFHLKLGSFIPPTPPPRSAMQSKGRVCKLYFVRDAS